MKADNKSVHEHDEEIDLKELFNVLWAGKIKIFIVTTIFAIGSVIYALSLPNQYKAISLLAPAQGDDGGLSGTLNQLSGFASLAGFRLGNKRTSESQIAQEIMKSWSFIHTFIAENDLAVEVYAATGWNKDSMSLKLLQRCMMPLLKNGF